MWRQGNYVSSSRSFSRSTTVVEAAAAAVVVVVVVVVVVLAIELYRKTKLQRRPQPGRRSGVFFFQQHLGK